LHVEIAQWPIDEVTEEIMILVRMRDCGIRKDALRRETKTSAELWLTRSSMAEFGLDPMSNHDDLLRRHTETFDDRASHVVTWNRDMSSTPNRHRETRLEVRTLCAREILGIDEVLQVVNGEQRWLRTTWRNRSATVVHEISGSCLTRKCRGLVQHSQRSHALFGRRLTQTDTLDKSRMCRGESTRSVNLKFKLVTSRLMKTNELTNQILLRTANTSRLTPQQIDHDSRHRRTPLLMASR
jgi:hypothetical protein